MSKAWQQMKCVLLKVIRLKLWGRDKALFMRKVKYQILLSGMCPCSPSDLSRVTQGKLRAKLVL